MKTAYKHTNICTADFTPYNKKSPGFPSMRKVLNAYIFVTALLFPSLCTLAECVVYVGAEVDDFSKIIVWKGSIQVSCPCDGLVPSDKHMKNVSHTATV